MPHLDYLRPQTGKPIATSWGQTVIDLLQQVGWEGAVDYYGIVHSDLIPMVDVALKLGIDVNRWLEVHGYSGYFNQVDVGQGWITSGDIETTIAGRGLIVTTPDGTHRYRIRVDDSGNVISELVS